MTPETQNGSKPRSGKSDARRATVLEMRGITKRFGAYTANDSISLDLKSGDIVALLGENGAGKTTLMNILFGLYVADEGKIRVAGTSGKLETLPPGSPQSALAAGIGMVHQHFTLAENLTGFENIVLGVEPLFAWKRKLAEARAKVEDLMGRSGLSVDLDTRVSSMAVGERQRVEILKALFRDARILVLDEPTAVLTPQEAKGLYKIIAMLAERGMAVVFISHKMHEVLSASHRIVVLRHGKVAGELETANADRKNLAELMVGREIPPSIRESNEPGEPILELDNVRIKAPDARRALREASLTVRRGEIIGVAGVSGNGQTALAGLISGLVAPDDGTVRFNGAPVTNFNPRAFMRMGIGRIPEDRHRDGVIGAMTVAENLAVECLDDPRFQTNGFLKFEGIRSYADKVISNYDIRCPGPNTAVRILSGGNMQKLILARALDREPRLILANQPARGLDISAQNEVYRRLLAARMRGAGVVLISEDLDELFTLADAIVVINEGRLRFAGGAGELDRGRVGMMMAGYDGRGAGTSAGGEAA